MSSKKDFVLNLVVFLALGFVFFIFFKSSCLHPQKLLFAPGDGAKNYFTYLYHIAHDDSFWRFDGMLYPYGENVIFTDNQPILANIVKSLQRLFDFNTTHLISIHNYVLFLGTVLGGFGIFLVLKKLNLDFWFALLFAGALMMLQPQLQRFYSHYSMVYPVLPWVFYAWIHIWENTKPLRNAIFIGVLSMIFGLTHMYHFLTIAVFCGLAAFLTVIEKPNKKEIKRLSVYFIIMTIIPLFFLMMMASQIEPEIDRPEKVWGFFSYHSSWEGLVFSNHHPLYHYINNNVTEIRKIDPFEAFNYIGLVSVIFILTAIIFHLIEWKKLKKRISDSLTISGKLMWIFVLSAFLSFGFPFTIKGFEWLLDYSGPFQQFRAIARVGWVSFYAVNFVAIPYLFQKSNHLNRYIKYPVLVILASILYWEAWIIKPVMSNPEHLENGYLSSYDFSGIEFADYQAMITDPYLHTGSECFHWGPVGLNQDQFFEVAYQIGLPSLVSIMSRTSLKQAIMMNQFVCKPYSVPSIIEELSVKDQRPLLVLESKLDLFSKNSSIEHWTRGTEIVFEHPQFRLRRLPLTDFEKKSKQFTDSLALNPSDTIFQHTLNFEHSYKEKAWGYEAIFYCDSTNNSQLFLSFNVDINENTDVNAILEVWQITSDHQKADQFSVRVNNYIKRLTNEKMYVEIPITLKPETNKLAIRFYKDNQKKKDILQFYDAMLYAIK